MNKYIFSILTLLFLPFFIHAQSPKDNCNTFDCVIGNVEIFIKKKQFKKALKELQAAKRYSYDDDNLRRRQILKDKENDLFTAVDSERMQAEIARKKAEKMRRELEVSLKQIKTINVKLEEEKRIANELSISLEEKISELKKTEGEKTKAEDKFKYVNLLLEIEKITGRANIAKRDGKYEESLSEYEYAKILIDSLSETTDNSILYVKADSISNEINEIASVLYYIYKGDLLFKSAEKNPNDFILAFDNYFFALELHDSQRIRNLISKVANSQYIEFKRTLYKEKQFWAIKARMVRNSYINGSDIFGSLSGIARNNPNEQYFIENDLGNIQKELERKKLGINRAELSFSLLSWKNNISVLQNTFHIKNKAGNVLNTNRYNFPSALGLSLYTENEHTLAVTLRWFRVGIEMKDNLTGQDKQLQITSTKRIPEGADRVMKYTSEVDLAYRHQLIKPKDEKMRRFSLQLLLAATFANRRQSYQLDNKIPDGEIDQLNFLTRPGTSNELKIYPFNPMDYTGKNHCSAMILAPTTDDRSIVSYSTGLAFQLRLFKTMSYRLLGEARYNIQPYRTSNSFHLGERIFNDIKGVNTFSDAELQRLDEYYSEYCDYNIQIGEINSNFPRGFSYSIGLAFRL